MMQNAEVEQDLQRRIQESRDWLDSDKLGLIAGLQIRGYPCKAEPVMFLDSPRRKERHGVRFRLEIVSPRGTYESFIEVRVRPISSMTKDQKSVANLPYIVSYVVNPETKATDEITHDHLEIPENYERTLPLSIEEWYSHWLNVALRNKNHSKIFQSEFRRRIQGAEKLPHRNSSKI
jgi:hypothetical protein